MIRKPRLEISKEALGLVKLYLKSWKKYKSNKEKI